MGELDAVGDVISGSALAQNVDPASGAEASNGHTRETACLNCSTPLVGDYCHACGQRGHVHRTLGAFGHDLIHGVLHFEGKIWRTLPLLAWKPGALTRRYIDGQRASFVSPIALFLFSVFLMFGVLSAAGNIDPVDRAEVKREMKNNARELEARLGRLDQERATLTAAKRPTTAIDARIASTKEDAAMMSAMAERGILAASAVRVSNDLPGWIRRPLEEANRNPALTIYKLRTNAYKWSWALIPLSVPFLWLLFPFSRRFRLYDHMVFVTYSLGFMTLLVVATSLLMLAGWQGALAVAMFVPPVHMFRQLKGGYGLTNFGALCRTVLLTTFALTAVLLFLAMILGLGLFD